MNKEHIYQAHIYRCLEEMYDRMANQLLDWLPQDSDGIDDSTFTPAQWESVLAVNAIEEEWLVDEEQRKQLSIINWTED